MTARDTIERKSWEKYFHRTVIERLFKTTETRSRLHWQWPKARTVSGSDHHHNGHGRPSFPRGQQEQKGTTRKWLARPARQTNRSKTVRQKATSFQPRYFTLNVDLRGKVAQPGPNCLLWARRPFSNVSFRPRTVFNLQSDNRRGAVITQREDRCRQNFPSGWGGGGGGGGGEEWKKRFRTRLGHWSYWDKNAGKHISRSVCRQPQSPCHSWEQLITLPWQMKSTSRFSKLK